MGAKYRVAEKLLPVGAVAKHGILGQRVRAIGFGALTLRISEKRPQTHAGDSWPYI
jgi:hypothetical protein